MNSLLLLVAAALPDQRGQGRGSGTAGSSRSGRQCVADALPPAGGRRHGGSSTRCSVAHPPDSALPPFGCGTGESPASSTPSDAAIGVTAPTSTGSVTPWSMHAALRVAGSAWPADTRWFTTATVVQKCPRPLDTALALGYPVDSWQQADGSCCGASACLHAVWASWVAETAAAHPPTAGGGAGVARLWASA